MQRCVQEYQRAAYPPNQMVDPLGLRPLVAHSGMDSRVSGLSGTAAEQSTDLQKILQSQGMAENCKIYASNVVTYPRIGKMAKILCTSRNTQ
jgi:hypothetical protein